VGVLRHRPGSSGKISDSKKKKKRKHGAISIPTFAWRFMPKDRILQAGNFLVGQRTLQAIPFAKKGQLPVRELRLGRLGKQRHQTFVQGCAGE